MPPTHKPHDYTPMEQRLLQTTSQFHRNFNARAFERNGELVADDLEVNSNGKRLHGRAAFIEQIARFVTPFPDVMITDLVTTIDGNVAVVRFVVTGTHTGPLDTPEGTVTATGRPIKVDGVECFTFDESGKLAQLLTIENQADLMRQIKGE